MVGAPLILSREAKVDEFDFFVLVEKNVLLGRETAVMAGCKRRRRSAANCELRATLGAWREKTQQFIVFFFLFPFCMYGTGRTGTDEGTGIEWLGSFYLF